MTAKLHTVEESGLAGRLIRAGQSDWTAFTEHAFVQGLQDGTLPTAAFRHYLVQDYLFLIHFSRAWALAAFKTDDVTEIRACTATVHALINDEISLHVRYCADFGLDEDQLTTAPEDAANSAYTRFVLERGHAGDLLDLLVALAPCVIGYGEIGRRLETDPATVKADNPYSDWIETYAGEDYQAVNRGAIEQLERVARARVGDAAWTSPRWPSLVSTFAQATRLEVGFWDMGLRAA